MGLLGIIAPLPSEGRAVFNGEKWRRLDGFRSLQSRLPGGGEAILLSPGPGWSLAEAAARALVARGADALAVMGVCGGLHPELRAGDLILTREILREGEQARYSGRVEFSGHPRIWRGALVTTCAPVLTAEDKAELYRRTGALAADLESAAAEGVARGAALPFVSIRAVCDPPHREVPSPLAVLASGDGRVRPVALLSLLCSRPDLIPLIWTLAGDFAAARRALPDGLRFAEALVARGDPFSAGFEGR